MNPYKFPWIMDRIESEAAGLRGKKLLEIQAVRLSPLDLLPQLDLREKIVDLVLRGVPENVHGLARQHLLQLRQALVDVSVEDARVVP